MPKVVMDVADGDNVLHYSREGWRCKRTAKIFKLSITPTPGRDSSGTLYAALTTIADIPKRGDPHPYIVFVTNWGNFANPATGNGVYYIGL